MVTKTFEENHKYGKKKLIFIMMSFCGSPRILFIL